MIRTSKWLLIGLVLSLLLLAACTPANLAAPACEAPEAEEPVEEAPAGEAVGPLWLSVSTLNNPFFVTLRDGAEAAAGEAGVQLVIVEAQDEAAQEATNIENLIEQGVSALLI